MAGSFAFTLDFAAGGEQDGPYFQAKAGQTVTISCPQVPPEQTGGSYRVITAGLWLDSWGENDYIGGGNLVTDGGSVEIGVQTEGQYWFTMTADPQVRLPVSFTVATNP